MKCKAYENIVNLKLYYQFRNMILQLAKTDTSQQDFTLFGNDKSFLPFEAEYGLRYAGEVLERFEDVCGNSVENFRAIAIAFADSVGLTDASMFVDKQKINFINKIRTTAHEDFYLIGALYKVSPVKEEREIIQKLYASWNYKSTQEVLYVLSVFQGNAEMWVRLAPLAARYLGKLRSFKVYQNEWLYTWFVETYSQEIKNCRGYELNLLKAVKATAMSHLKIEDKFYGILTNAGYSRQEIIYLNLSVTLGMHNKDALIFRKYTWVRLQEIFCKELSETSEFEDDAICDICVDRLQWLSDRSVKGKYGIETQAGVTCLEHILNVTMFKRLYILKEQMHIPYSCFCINILDNKWDELCSFLKLEEYMALFEYCVVELKPCNLAEWVDKFFNLTGKSYIDLLRSHATRQSGNVISAMVNAKLINLVEQYKEHRQDLKLLSKDEMSSKWDRLWYAFKDIAYNLTSLEVYELWEYLADKDGYQSIIDFTGRKDTIINSLHYYRNYYSDNTSMCGKLDFLDKEQSEKLFSWAEQYVYECTPREYWNFLQRFVTGSQQHFMSKEELQPLVDIIIDNSGEGNQSKLRLMKACYNDTVCEAYERKLQEADIQNRIEEAEAEMQGAREAALQTLQESDEEFDEYDEDEEIEVEDEDSLFVIAKLIIDNHYRNKNILKGYYSVLKELLDDDLKPCDATIYKVIEAILIVKDKIQMSDSEFWSIMRRLEEVHYELAVD